MTHTRQVVLDTETTGLDPKQGHRIIEVGAVELINRRITGNHFHFYVNPEREVEQGAIEVHGITNEFLADKPLFKDIANGLLEFISGAELIIHNAPFDVGFMDNEFRIVGETRRTADVSTVLDTLALARRLHPGQKNTLDALCKRYDVSNAKRELHGALLDSEILADVYLMMTGGQSTLSLGESNDGDNQAQVSEIRRAELTQRPRVIAASDDELSAHEDYLTLLDKTAGTAVWRQIDAPISDPETNADTEQ